MEPVTLTCLIHHWTVLTDKFNLPAISVALDPKSICPITRPLRKALAALFALALGNLSLFIIKFNNFFIKEQHCRLISFKSDNCVNHSSKNTQLSITMTIAKFINTIQVRRSFYLLLIKYALCEIIVALTIRFN